MPFDAAVATARIDTTGVVDATVPGFGVPDACYVFTTGGPGDGVVQANASHGFGFMCAQGQRGMGIRMQTGVNASNTSSGVSIDHIIAMPNNNATDYIKKGTGTFITDGVRFNITTANESPLVISVMLIKGVVNSAIGDIRILPPQTSTLGFQPNFAMVAWARAADFLSAPSYLKDTEAGMSWGAAVLQPNGTTLQQTYAFYQQDGDTQFKQSTNARLGGRIGVRLDRATTTANALLTAEFTATGITWTGTGGLGSAFAYMALKLDPDGMADLGFGTFRTSMFYSTREGYSPIAVTLQNTSEQTGYQIVLNAGVGNNLWHFDKRGTQRANCFFDKDSTVTTVTGHVHFNSPMRSINGDGVVDATAGTPTFGSGSWYFDSIDGTKSRSWGALTFSKRSEGPPASDTILRGSTPASAIYKGSQAATAVYQGATKIWPTDQPVEYVSTWSNVSDSGITTTPSTSVSIVPLGVKAGDVVIASVSVSQLNVGDKITAAGWTRVFGQTINPIYGTSGAAFYRVMDGTETVFPVRSASGTYSLPIYSFMNFRGAAPPVAGDWKASEYQTTANDPVPIDSPVFPNDRVAVIGFHLGDSDYVCGTGYTTLQSNFRTSGLSVGQAVGWKDGTPDTNEDPTIFSRNGDTLNRGTTSLTFVVRKAP